MTYVFLVSEIKTNPSHGIAFAPGESQKSPLDDVTNAPNLHDDGTAVITIVVTICVVAVVVVGSFNLIIIYKKLKYVETVFGTNKMNKAFEVHYISIL